MRQFKAAWDRFAGDEANLTEFLNAKRMNKADLGALQFALV
jgi:hypothetical protein